MLLDTSRNISYYSSNKHRQISHGFRLPGINPTGQTTTPSIPRLKAVGTTLRTILKLLHGADDPFVPAEQVKAFETEMRQGNVDWQFISYGRTVHSFTNPEAKGEMKGVE